MRLVSYPAPYDLKDPTVTPTQGTICVARSLFLAAVVMVLVTLAHVVGGGMVPGLGAVTVGTTG